MASISRQELLDILRQCAEQSQIDPESAHGDADDALLQFINDEEVTHAWHEIHKWFG